MQTSKMFFFKFILGLNLLTLAACNLPSPKDKTEGGSEAATFTIDSIKGTASAEQMAGAFALPDSRVFNFSVCVKDVAYDKTIAGHKFAITEANQKITSDAAGCINWSEKIKYNYLGDSQYIELKRHIQGLGLHKGTREIDVAINPWSHGENLPSVVDLRKEQVDNLVTDDQATAQALKGFSTDNKLRTRKLWMEDGRLFVIEQKMTPGAINLSMEFRGNPSIQLTKMNGEFVLRNLASGSFKARLSLIHIYNQDNKEIHRLLAQSAEFNSTMENGSLALKAIVPLTAVPTRGQMAFGLELSPINGPEGLASFQGIYMLNEYDQIKGSNFLKIGSQVAQTQNFKLDGYINSEAVTPSTVTNSSALSETYLIPKYEVRQPMKMEWIRTDVETNATRKFIYSVEACVRNSVDKKPTSGHTFKITMFRENESQPAQHPEPVTSNSDGCFKWNETYTYNYTGCQHQVKGTIEIHNETLGMSEKIPVLFNPWEANFNNFRDLRMADKNEKFILDCKERPRTQVMMSSFSYNTNSTTLSADKLMNVTTTKKLQVKIQPTMIAYSSQYSQRSENSQPLRDGIYLLKMVIVTNPEYESKLNYIASDEKLVNVVGGTISTEMTFPVQFGKALGNRNSVLVEVHPIDESKVNMPADKTDTVTPLSLKDPKATLDSAIDKANGLQSPTFAGNIILDAAEGSRELHMANASPVSSFLVNGNGSNAHQNVISSIIEKGRKEQSDRMKSVAARANTVTYAMDNNLDLITLNTAADRNTLGGLVPSLPGRDARLLTTKQDLQEIITTGKLKGATAQKLCAFWAQDYLTRMNKKKGGAILPDSVLGFATACYNTVKQYPTRFFQVERQTAIKQLLPLSKEELIESTNQGQNWPIQVGTSYSMGRSHNTSRTTSQSLSAKAGLGTKFLDLFSVGADYAVQISWSKSDNTGVGNSLSVNTGVTLQVKQNILKVRLGEYEKCAVVRLNPALFIKHDKSWYNFKRTDYVDILNPELTENEMTAAVSRGLLLCDGVTQKTPQDVYEYYYAIYQDVPAGATQDPGDPRSRQYYITLRSNADYYKFVTAIKSDVKLPQTSNAAETIQDESVRILSTIFALGSSASPGMFRN
jgi:hypothetical protein